jgi:recombination protein RecA
MKSNTSNSLNNVLSQIDKLYGESAIFRMDSGVIVEAEAISTSSNKIDSITGIGGIPRGRITEIYGAESSGKTTISLLTIAQAQQKYPDEQIAIVDVEHALDMEYAKKLGVDVSKLFLSQPSNAEEALNIIKMLGESGEFSLIVLDSVAALKPRAEIEGEIGDQHMAQLARLMSSTIKLLVPIVSKSNTALLFTNQLRSNIGSWGNPETTTGGNALKFYASMRMELKHAGFETNSKQEKIGKKVKVRIIKNKCAPPFKECEIKFRFDTVGIDIYSDLIERALELGIYKKGGAWFNITEKVKFQGEDKLRAELSQSNKKLFNWTQAQIDKKLNKNENKK